MLEYDLLNLQWRSTKYATQWTLKINRNSLKIEINKLEFLK